MPAALWICGLALGVLRRKTQLKTHFTQCKIHKITKQLLL